MANPNPNQATQFSEGNQAAADGRRWRQAINRAVSRKKSARSKVIALDALADKLVEAGLAGDISALKEIGNRLNEERKVIRKDREDIAVQVGQLMRVIKFINGYDREPRITQQVVSLDSNVGGAVMGLRVNVYYKSFWVHSKIDVYYKKQNTWYLDKIDVTKKTSAARGIALDNLMTDYITKKN